MNINNNTRINLLCHLSWAEAVNLSSQIYADCLCWDKLSLNRFLLLQYIFGEDLVLLSTKFSLSYLWDGALHGNIIYMGKI